MWVEHVYLLKLKIMSEKHLGLGVMLGLLAGNEETVNTLNAAIGKIIVFAELKDDVLTLKFDDGSGLKVRDDGQSCCEARYMVSGDQINGLIGGKLLKMKIWTTIYTF